MRAPLPSNEARRLKVLWQYEVLDTVPEEVFDDLTELAARICEAPIALISLVDESRQWFKAKVGVSATETSRDISFCAYAITQPGVFIVADTLKDKRFAQNPMVLSGPKIRFYAGAPLITPDGYAMGTLCVIDMKPRVLRPDQKEALTVLARHIVSQLELRRRTKDLSIARQAEKSQKAEIAKLRGELEKARRKIQRLERKSSPGARVRRNA
jgi:GAF domain-containing protein